MRVAGSTLIHVTLPIEEALDGLRALDFEYVEIDLFPWAHFDPQQAVDSGRRLTRRIETACRHSGLTPVALSLGLHGTLEQQRDQVAGCSRLAADLEIQHLTFQADKADSPIEDDLYRARELLSAARPYSRSLSVETHLFAHTEDPRAALRYASEVPGLGITLDPSHFEAGGHQAETYRALLPSVRFLHVRSAGRGGWKEIQVPAGTGGIDFPKLLEDLRKHGFDGDLCVEYVEGLGTVEDAAKEAKKMFELLDRALATSGSGGRPSRTDR